MMTDTKRRLGYLETISQPLALKVENLMLEYQAIWQALKQADEATFYQLAPHLFVTIEQKEPWLVEALESTPEGYELFKTLLKEEK